MNRKKVYKINEFAKEIGVCPRTLKRWDKDGKLVAKRTPTGMYFYTVDQLEEYLGMEVDYDEFD